MHSTIHVPRTLWPIQLANVVLEAVLIRRWALALVIVGTRNPLLLAHTTHVPLARVASVVACLSQDLWPGRDLFVYSFLVDT